MMRKCFFGLVAVLVLAPCHALAQGTGRQSGGATVEEIRSNYRLHLGPVYLNPTVALKELGIDTNVFNESEQPKSDFTFTVGPQAEIALPIARRALLATTLGLDLIYYQRYATERSINPQIAGRGEIYLHRLTLFAEGSHLNTNERINYEVDERARRLQDAMGGGVVLRVTPKVSLEVGAYKSKTRFAADEFFQGQQLNETLNIDTDAVSVIARHKLSALTTLSFRVENLRDHFPLLPERDADSYRITGGADFKPRALIRGSATMGYRNFRPKNPLIPEYTGLVGNLGLAYKLKGSNEFGVDFLRDVNYSYEQLQPYFVAQGTGISYRRALGGNYDALVSANRTTYTYRNLLLAPAGTPEAPQRVDTTINYEGGIGYTIKRATRLGFSVSNWQRESTTRDSVTYDSVRIRTTVSYRY